MYLQFYELLLPRSFRNWLIRIVHLFIFIVIYWSYLISKLLLESIPIPSSLFVVLIKRLLLIFYVVDITLLHILDGWLHHHPQILYTLHILTHISHQSLHSTLSDLRWPSWWTTIQWRGGIWIQLITNTPKITTLHLLYYLLSIIVFLSLYVLINGIHATSYLLIIILRKLVCGGHLCIHRIIIITLLLNLLKLQIIQHTVFILLIALVCGWLHLRECVIKYLWWILIICDLILLIQLLRLILIIHA